MFTSDISKAIEFIAMILHGTYGPVVIAVFAIAAIFIIFQRGIENPNRRRINRK